MLVCRDEDYALALVDGAFTKALVVQLVRKIEGKQFYDVRTRHTRHPVLVLHFVQGGSHMMAWEVPFSRLQILHL